MKDLHPFLALFPASFNSKTSLVIGLPMTTAQYNEGNPFVVPTGTAKDTKQIGQVMSWPPTTIF